MSDHIPPEQDPRSDAWRPSGVVPALPPPPPLAPPQTMIPGGDGYTWRPAGQEPPRSPASVHPASTATQQRRGGVLGAIVAAAFGLFKYGFVLLKFGKLGGTFISFGISLLIYIGLFGWPFGLGAILLIAIHEYGHLVFARLQGLAVSSPIFLFGFGAVVRTAGFRDARQEAIVAIGGPLTGTGAALLCYLFAAAPPHGHTRYLFLALAYWGCLINLFNLIPMSPLDGGRVASAVSKWANVAGIAIVLLLIAGYSAVGRFRRAKAGHEPPPLPTRTRALIGLAYVAMLVISAAGMSAAHSTLLTHGIGQQVV